MKRPKKETRRKRQELYKTPAGYQETKRKKTARQLNKEINKVTSSILENTKDLDPEFSKAVDENFWGLV